MRKCRHCRTEIPPKAKSDFYQSAGFCGNACMASHGLEKARQQRERKAQREAKRKRAETRKRKEALKSRSDWAREAQQAFNAWIRARDAGKPCVSCDRPDDGSHQRHASHYRSRGACPELAFEPLNVHASCAQCNSHLSGNIVEYRLRLRDRIGEEALEWLEGPHEAKKYTAEELKEIKRHYLGRAKALRNGYNKG